jgi:hypothetical protein
VEKVMAGTMSKEQHEIERVNKIKGELELSVSGLLFKNGDYLDPSKTVSLIESLVDAKIAQTYARIEDRNAAAEHKTEPK